MVARAKRCTPKRSASSTRNAYSLNHYYFLVDVDSLICHRTCSAGEWARARDSDCRRNESILFCNLNCLAYLSLTLLSGDCLRFLVIPTVRLGQHIDRKNNDKEKETDEERKKWSRCERHRSCFSLPQWLGCLCGDGNRALNNYALNTFSSISPLRSFFYLAKCINHIDWVCQLVLYDFYRKYMVLNGHWAYSSLFCSFQPLSLRTVHRQRMPIVLSRSRSHLIVRRLGVSGESENTMKYDIERNVWSKNTIECVRRTEFRYSRILKTVKHMHRVYSNTTIYSFASRWC